MNKDNIMSQVDLLVAKTNAWYAVLSSKTRSEHAARMARFAALERALTIAKNASHAEEQA